MTNNGQHCRDAWRQKSFMHHEKEIMLQHESVQLWRTCTYETYLLFCKWSDKVIFSVIQTASVRSSVVGRSGKPQVFIQADNRIPNLATNLSRMWTWTKQLNSCRRQTLSDSHVTVCDSIFERPWKETEMFWVIKTIQIFLKSPPV